MKTTIRFTNCVHHSRSDLLLVSLLVGCFVVLPTAEAVLPAPDGGYPGANTAEGQSALSSLTTGVHNTALGFQALFRNTTGNTNTASGSLALFNNTIGIRNTAAGFSALTSNTTGIGNTANGAFALFSNTNGYGNTANGQSALTSNTSGGSNTATGTDALASNTTGNFNTADGVEALSGGLFGPQTGSSNTAVGFFASVSNTFGGSNVAVGAAALYLNAGGSNNTAIGSGALEENNGGSNNIAIGFEAGDLTTGANNIVIGHNGVGAESNTIRIGDPAIQTATYIAGISGATVPSGVTVVVGSDGHLGTLVSSARFKDDIKPMDKASESILALKPVTFHYKKELDPNGTPQFGLVAEQVEKIDPHLVARDAQGKPYTVRYDAVNAMLLNEFLKEHRKVEDQEATIRQLSLTVAQQQNDFHAMVAQLTRRLDEQASQIQKVSAQLTVNRQTSQIISSSH
jgi:trimeric autotransporter adhesin